MAKKRTGNKAKATKGAGKVKMPPVPKLAKLTQFPKAVTTPLPKPIKPIKGVK